MKRIKIIRRTYQLLKELLKYKIEPMAIIGVCEDLNSSESLVNVGIVGVKKEIIDDFKPVGKIKESIREAVEKWLEHN